MTNLFARKIGIYYKDISWRDEMFNKVLSFIPKNAIDRVIDSRLNKSILLKDETSIRFISQSDSSRGYRFTDSFIQPGTPKTICDTIIYPKVIWNGGVYFLTKDDESFYKAYPVESYYKQMLSFDDNKSTK